MSVQKNVALHEIIKQYEKQKQAKLEERRKVEIKKYFDEYNSIETRVDLMKGKGAFSTCVCVCVCVFVCTSIHREDFTCLDQFDCLGTDQRCSVEDVS